MGSPPPPRPRRLPDFTFRHSCLTNANVVGLDPIGLERTPNFVPRDKADPREGCRAWVDELRYSWISRHLRGALAATLVTISVSKPSPLAQVVGSLVSAVGAKPNLTRPGREQVSTYPLVCRGQQPQLTYPKRSSARRP